MKHGFGMIEMMVALAILSTALIAEVSLASLNVRMSREAEYKTLAVNLAREAVEVVRAIRDTNRLGNVSNPLRTNLSNGTDYTAVPVLGTIGTPSWSLDFSPTSISDSEASLYRLNGFYVQGASAEAGAIMPFRRFITLHEICSDGSMVSSGFACTSKVGIQVIAEVEYDMPGGTKGSSIMEDRLYAWQ